MKKRIKNGSLALGSILCVFCFIFSAFSGVKAEEKERISAVLYPEDGSAPFIPYDSYPRMDGSLACVPLCEAVAMEVTGCSEEEAEATLDDFSNTNPCYLHLAEGERDILLAYEPAQETVDALMDYPALDMEPVGKDALVFLVNDKNPVESVTREQLIGIFTGEITNWKEVGGNDQEIKAFRRPETSGSQTLMRLLLIGDKEMVDERLETVSTMDGIISRMTDYDNSSNALGYSVFYYASAMFQQPGLKFLKVDGVEPSNETIASGEYPLVNAFYCVTNEQSSEEAIAIRDWLTGGQGQRFVEECGYVPVNP